MVDQLSNYWLLASCPNEKWFFSDCDGACDTLVDNCLQVPWWKMRRRRQYRSSWQWSPTWLISRAAVVSL